MSTTLFHEYLDTIRIARPFDYSSSIQNALITANPFIINWLKMNGLVSTTLFLDCLDMNCLARPF